MCKAAYFKNLDNVLYGGYASVYFNQIILGIWGRQIIFLTTNIGLLKLRVHQLIGAPG